MREWWTARELAARALPGVPGTKAGVILAASRDSWRWRDRAGRGGGREYHVSALPPAARAALAAGSVVRDQGSGIRGELGALLVAAPAWARSRADARVAVLRRCERFLEDGELSAKAGRAHFVELYNAGRIAGVDDATRAALPTISARSLERWLAELAAEGAKRLAGRYGGRRPVIGGMPEVVALITGMLATHPHASAKQVMRALRARFDGQALPSYRSVQRYMASWKAEHQSTFEAVTNPDRWKGRRLVALGRADEDVERLNQRWEMDSTPADLMLIDGRHALVGCIDVGTRRLRLLVSQTSKATAIGLCLRRALLDWGVPETVVTDQGADYTSKHVTRLLADLQVSHRVCAPFSPERKPHIERAFHTVAHGLVELLPGFIGHNVAEAQDIRARRSFADRLMQKGEAIEIRLDGAALQAFLDRWCDELYAHERHGGIGRSPFEAAASWRGPVRRIEDERALDALLAEAPGDGYRVAGKKGIRLDGLTYIAAELGLVVGERVRVLRDPADLGRIIVYAGRDERFLCIAEASEVTGIDRRAVALAARAKQKAFIAAQRKALKANAKAQGLGDIAFEILDERRRHNANLVAFPTSITPHETPALTEAAKAAQALDAPRGPTPLTADEIAAADAALGALAAAPKAVNRLTAEEEAEIDRKLAAMSTEKLRARVF
ncbi:MAG: DNA-binding protein [Alphaproteobacteria bacterium]